jgi:hypothetical protein
VNHLLTPARPLRDEVVTERGRRPDDRPPAFDVQTSASRDERTIIRGGKTRTFEFSVRMFTAAELRTGCSRPGSGHARVRRGRRAADARAPRDDRRRPEVRVTISARFRHPRVTISSIRSQWGGGRGTGPRRRSAPRARVDELDRSLDASWFAARSSSGSRPTGAGAEPQPRRRSRSARRRRVEARQPSSRRIASPPTGTISRG